MTRIGQSLRDARGLGFESSAGLRYAVAVVAALVFIGVRAAVDPVLGVHSPYLPSVIAVIVAARFGGRGPGLASAAISVTGITYLFLEPRYSLSIADPAARAGMALFAVVSIVISLLVGHLRESLLATARAQQALERKIQLIDLSHDAVISLDANRTITGWSSGAATMYGWTEPEAIGKPIRELLHTRSQIPPDEMERVLNRDGRWTGELIHTARDGRQVICECQIALLRDAKGAVCAVLQTDLDVTTRRLAEEERTAVNRQKIAILESISDGFHAFDREWRYTYVNPAAAKMLGREPGELLGNIVWELWPQFSDSPFGLAYRRSVAENTPVQVEAFFPEPLDKWIEVRCYPSPDGLSVFFTDTTGRRHAEERLRQAQKLESIGLLAGGIAHDFNNLLTVIVGTASEALEQCPSCENFRTVLTAADRAAYLTRQLLAYAGKGHAFVKVIDLTDLVRHSAALLSASVPKKVRLSFHLSKDLPYLEADPGQLSQILMNLVVNAGEAIPSQSEGFIEIATTSCEVAPETATLHSQAYDVAPGPYVCLEVRDNGAGMDESTVSHIFDPFFTTKFTGRGLGLAAVHGIVRASKGFIEVRSAPNEGTTFRVFLPASPKNMPTAHARSTPHAQPRDTRAQTILVVDDEDMVRKLACEALRRHGYQVQEAVNGKDALEVLAASPAPPSLALLDLAMPVMGGDELATVLMAQHPDLKIVMTSGYPEEEARRLAPNGSIAGFLQKPFTVAALAEEVGRVLEGQ